MRELLSENRPNLRNNPGRERIQGATFDQQSANAAVLESIYLENLRKVLIGPQVATSFTMRSIQLPRREPSSLGNRIW